MHICVSDSLLFLLEQDNAHLQNQGPTICCIGEWPGLWWVSAIELQRGCSSAIVLLKAIAAAGHTRTHGRGHSGGHNSGLNSAIEDSKLLHPTSLVNFLCVCVCARARKILGRLTNSA